MIEKATYHGNCQRYTVKKSVNFNTSCVDTEVTRRIRVPWHTNSVSFNTFFRVSTQLVLNLKLFFYSVFSKVFLQLGSVFTVNMISLVLILHFGNL